LILLFRAFRASDVTWIVAPFERLAGRRRTHRVVPEPTES
jgi:hypothetical protein